MISEQPTEAFPRTLLVGVDGGASGFRAFEIRVRETPAGRVYALGAHSAAELVEPITSFTPKAIDQQRDEATAERYDCSPQERALQARWITAASRAVWRVAAACGHQALRVGLCAPGIKTQDGRGIALALNGPRIPNFLDALEQSMLLDGLNLAAPIDRIHSDGLACAWGEELAEGGSFCGVRHAYYVGGGSGVAEAYKLGGSIHGADDVQEYLKKAWQLHADDGRSFERHLSAAGLNQDFGLGHAGSAQVERWPEDAAAEGEARALELFAARAERLAELCAARLGVIHDAHGIALERIVVGQRLGQFFLDPRLEACFAARARAALCARRADEGAPGLRAAWANNGALAPGRLVGSSLRAAAAIGSVALSLENDR